MSASTTNPRKAGAKKTSTKLSGIPLSAIHKIAGVSDQTIWNWRQGSASKEPLPTHSVATGETARVFITPAKLVAWAKKHKVELKAKELAAFTK